MHLLWPKCTLKILNYCLIRCNFLWNCHKLNWTQTGPDSLLLLSIILIFLAHIFSHMPLFIQCKKWKDLILPLSKLRKFSASVTSQFLLRIKIERVMKYDTYIITSKLFPTDELINRRHCLVLSDAEDYKKLFYLSFTENLSVLHKKKKPFMN